MRCRYVPTLLVFIVSIATGLSFAREDPKQATEPVDENRFRCVRTIKAPETTLTGRISLSADGRTLAAAGMHTIYIWDVMSGKEISRCYHEGGNFAGLIPLAPNGSTLAATFAGCKEIYLFDVRSGRCDRKLPHEGPVNGLSWAPNGKTLVSVALELAQLSDIETGEEIWRTRFVQDDLSQG